MGNIISFMTNNACYNGVGKYPLDTTSAKAKKSYGYPAQIGNSTGYRMAMYNVSDVNRACNNLLVGGLVIGLTVGLLLHLRGNTTDFAKIVRPIALAGIGGMTIFNIAPAAGRLADHGINKAYGAKVQD